MARTGSSASREWMKHAWDDATLEWLLSLDPDDFEEVWAATFERAADACESNPGDPRLLPSEDFLIRLLTRIGDEEYEDEYEDKDDFEVELDGDPLLDAIQSVRPYLADSVLSYPGVLRGVTFDAVRAQKCLDKYVLPFLEGEEVAIDILDVLAAPTFPQDLVMRAVKAMLEPVRKAYLSWNRLTTWNAYLSGAKDSVFLAGCADIMLAALKENPTRNKDNGLYVNLLASTTSHPLFPASWAEKHRLAGDSSYPIATHDDAKAFKAKYPLSGNEDSVLWQTRKDSQANQAMDLGLFVLWSVPGMVDDEQAFSRGRKLVRSGAKAKRVGALPAVGYYLYRIQEMKEQLGTPDIPDEWVDELLS